MEQVFPAMTQICAMPCLANAWAAIAVNWRRWRVGKALPSGAMVTITQYRTLLKLMRRANRRSKGHGGAVSEFNAARQVAAKAGELAFRKAQFTGYVSLCCTQDSL